MLDADCSNCGRAMSIPGEMEPTIFCHDCAHAVAELQTALNAGLCSAHAELADVLRDVLAATDKLIVDDALLSRARNVLNRHAQ